MTAADYAALKPVSVSLGMMLESASARLCQKGGPHWGSPDQDPAVRRASIAAAGNAGLPFPSGILIGIGETRAERIQSPLALRAPPVLPCHLPEISVPHFPLTPVHHLPS